MEVVLYEKAMRALYDSISDSSTLDELSFTYSNFSLSKVQRGTPAKHLNMHLKT